MRFQCFDVDRLPALGMRSGPPRSQAEAAGPEGGEGEQQRPGGSLCCWIVGLLSFCSDCVTTSFRSGHHGRDQR